jgi:hypothetical protein
MKEILGVSKRLTPLRMPNKTAGNVFGHILNIKDQTTTTTYHHSNQQGPSIQTQKTRQIF